MVLRRLFRQPGMLAEWDQIERGVVSALAEVECLRTIDRLRLSAPPGSVAEDELAIRREMAFTLWHSLETVELTRPVLSRAAQPFPTALGTLDAIHLATALLWQEETGHELVFTTHDASLGRAARACGLAVLGI